MIAKDSWNISTDHSDASVFYPENLQKKTTNMKKQVDWFKCPKFWDTLVLLYECTSIDVVVSSHMKESTIRKINSEVFSFSFPFSATIPYLVAIFLYNYISFSFPFSQIHKITRWDSVRFGTLFGFPQTFGRKTQWKRVFVKRIGKKLQWLNLDDSEKTKKVNRTKQGL